jgi:hypothetical protein
MVQTIPKVSVTEESMKIEWIDVDRLVPYERNPRQNDQAVEAVARSIREYGFQQPIVVDADGVIIVGHTRWKAARQLPGDQFFALLRRHALSRDHESLETPALVPGAFLVAMKS